VTAKDGVLQVLSTGDFRKETSANIRSYLKPNGGERSFGATHVGALKIILPTGWSNTMWDFFVDVYELSGLNLRYRISGYAYGSGNNAWYEPRAILISGGEETSARSVVRFGYDSVAGKCCVIIGDVTGVSWNNAFISVNSVSAYYTTTDTDGAWAISGINTLTGITGIIQKTPILNATTLGGIGSSGFALASHTQAISTITGLQTTLDGKANLTGGNSFNGMQVFYKTGTATANETAIAMSLTSDSTYRTSIQNDGSMVFSTGASDGWTTKATLSRKSTGVLQVGSDAIIVQPVLDTAIAGRVAKAGDTMTGALSITNSTASTSTTTGALIVSGGVGIGGSVNIGGSATISNIKITGVDILSNLSELYINRLNGDGSTTNYRNSYIYDGKGNQLFRCIGGGVNSYCEALSPMIVPNATANTHALNRITADGRFAPIVHGHSDATESVSGFMSAFDKIKLNNYITVVNKNYTVPNGGITTGVWLSPIGETICQSGFGYRIRTITLGTSESNGNFYLIHQAGSVWDFKKIVEETHNVSPKIYVTGEGAVYVYHENSVPLTIKVLVEKLDLGNTYVDPSVFGADGLIMSGLKLNHTHDVNFSPSNNNELNMVNGYGGDGKINVNFRNAGNSIIKTTFCRGEGSLTKSRVAGADAVETDDFVTLGQVFKEFIPVTTITQWFDLAKPTNNSLFCAHSNTYFPNGTGDSYWYYTIISKRDVLNGTTSLLVGQDSGRVFSGNQSTGTSVTVWKEHSMDGHRHDNAVFNADGNPLNKDGFMSIADKKKLQQTVNMFLDTQINSSANAGVTTSTRVTNNVIPEGANISVTFKPDGETYNIPVSFVPTKLANGLTTVYLENRFVSSIVYPWVVINNSTGLTTASGIFTIKIYS
jgi:hypothetical protein